MQGKSKDPLMAPLNMEDMMSGFETFYLIGAIAAFAAFANYCGLCKLNLAQLSTESGY